MVFFEKAIYQDKVPTDLQESILSNKNTPQEWNAKLNHFVFSKFVNVTLEALEIKTNLSGSSVLNKILLFVRKKEKVEKISPNSVIIESSDNLEFFFLDKITTPGLKSVGTQMMRSTTW